jgi:hypothetical protein
MNCPNLTSEDPAQTASKRDTFLDQGRETDRSDLYGVASWLKETADYLGLIVRARLAEKDFSPVLGACGPPEGMKITAEAPGKPER